MPADTNDPLRPDRPWVSAESFYTNLLGGPAAGAGGEYSTAGDMMKFALALEDGRLLDHRAFLNVVGSGLGCVCYVAGGHHIYSHTGGGPGVDTGVQLDVESGFISVFLSNFSPPFPQILAEDLEGLLRK